MVNKFKRITIHWTAGTNKPNAHEKECYHFLVDDKGKVTKGNHKPEDNLDCSSNYAPHTGGGNTGNIGVAMCGMINKNFSLTAAQVEATCKLVAELSKKYNIPINSDSVLTHAEFGRKFPNSSSYGKIDIDKIPCMCLYGIDVVGSKLRQKIAWYRQRL